LKVEKQYKDRVEATIAGARSIADCCVKSQTVKRLIYTATVLASSPLNEHGSGYKSCMDESCWTPSDLSLTYANDYVMVFLLSYPELPLRMMLVTIRKSINTNGNTKGIFSSVNFRGILPMEIFSRYIPRELPWEKKLKQNKKNDDVSFLLTELPTNAYVKFLLLKI
jgi:hypothetical protein